ncbi:TolC family protein [Silvanigrella sp.]|jgi:outer membrane protein TolC|uniref:TolC family protein n=1 Tax=Silvanigrella sp. TaxID=2024976 RepID=UPI0037C53EE0
MRPIKKLAYLFLTFNLNSYAQELNSNKIILSLDLEKAMDIAEKNSSEVKLTNTELQNFNSQHTLSFFKLGPSLSVQGSTNWYPNQNSNYNSSSPDRKADASISLEQPITGLWQNAYKISELSSKTDSASFDLKGAKIKARTEGAQTFINSQQAYNDLEIKKAAYEYSTLLYKETSILFETGDETKDKIDLLLSQANAAKSEIAYENAKNEFQNKVADLKKALNLNENVSIQIKNEDKSNWEKQENKIPELNTLLNQSQKNRSEIKSLDSKIKATNSNIAYQNFNFLPSASFVSSYSNSESFGNKSNALDPNSGTFLSDNSFSVGLKLSWTIWDSGISLSNRIDSVNELEKNKINKDKKLIDISNEVINAFNNLKTSILVLPQSKSVAEVLEQAYKLSKIKYKTGNLNASELIKTQNEFINSKIELSKLRSDIDNNWIKLQAAIGKNPISSDKR